MYFRLLKSCAISSADIVVGKENVLYETAYVREYCLQRTNRETLAAMVRNLKRFQDECERRHIAFVFLITPSKGIDLPGIHSLQMDEAL